MINFRINIAGIIISFKCLDNKFSYESEREDGFKNFIYKGGRSPDLNIFVKYGGLPDLKDAKKIFEVGGIRCLYSQKNKIFYRYFKPETTTIERIAEVNKDFKNIIVYENDRKISISAKKAGEELIEELKANFLRPFLPDYLANLKKGIIVHAAFIKDNGRTYLFMGKSGSGKTTMAKIWIDRFKTEGLNQKQRIFNDDRGILMAKDKGVSFFNVPWIGEIGRFFKPEAAGDIKVDNIFFIYQGRNNIAKLISRKESALKIFRNSFPVFWHKRQLSYALETCKKIAQKAVCYDLKFVNDESVVDYIRNLN